MSREAFCDDGSCTRTSATSRVTLYAMLGARVDASTARAVWCGDYFEAGFDIR